MQLKHATAIIVLLLLVASLSVAGCTSSSNKATINPLAADNLAGAINDRYKALSYNKTLNYTVKTPFTMTKQDDKITYHGVIAEPPDKFMPGIITTFNVTIVLTTNSSTAEDTYSNLKSTLKEKEKKGGGLAGGFFTVVSGSEKDPEHPGTFEGVAISYRVAKFDPTKYGAVIASPNSPAALVPDKEIPLNSGDMSSYYEILTIERGGYSTSKS
jgi:hypothetical protein